MTDWPLAFAISIALWILIFKIYAVISAVLS